MAGNCCFYANARWEESSALTGKAISLCLAYSREFALEQNYPNPFNPSTTIEWTLKERGWVRLAVVDLLEREVSVLVNGEVTAGSHAVVWEASGMSSGVYVYRVTAGGFTRSRKMVLMR